MVSKKNMPWLSPVLIDTKGRNFFYQLYVVLFNVRNWRVEKDWYVQLPNGTVVVIPEGFIFDGASTPKLFWALMAPTGSLLLPGLVHDFGYRYSYLWAVCKQTGVPYKYGQCRGQKFFDEIFRDVSLSVSGLKFVSVFSYLTLRLFGFLAWRSNRKLGAQEISPAAHAGGLGQRVDFECN